MWRLLGFSRSFLLFFLFVFFCFFERQTQNSCFPTVFMGVSSFQSRTCGAAEPDTSRTLHG